MSLQVHCSASELGEPSLFGQDLGLGVLQCDLRERGILSTQKGSRPGTAVKALLRQGTGGGSKAEEIMLLLA